MDADSHQHALFLKHLDAIEHTLVLAVRRHRLAPDEAEDFCQTVRLKLIEDDCRRLRAFQERSSFSTFLHAVVLHCLQDWRNARLGKWRPSARAKRLGPDAELFERLHGRDGLSHEEAIQVMRSNHGVHLSPAEIEKLAERLTPRRPRRFEGEDLLQDLPAPGEAPDQRLERLQADAERQRIVEALFDQFSELPPEDRLILRMRYLEGLKVVTIARALDLEQRKLYSRIEKLRKTLRARLQALGISWKSAL